MNEPELLDRGAVQTSLTPEAAGLMQEFILLDVIDSTNAELMRRLQAGAGGGLVCVAEQQSAGRGRRGRQWVSPFASNLYLSLTGDFPGGAATLEGLSLAVGVAVAEALETFGLRELQLKWPNDILLAGSKLGGVLIETNGNAADSCQAVVGVGVNVCMPRSPAADIDQDWTDVTTALGRNPGRNRLLGAMLNRLLPLMVEYGETGFAHWRERWLSRNAFAGCAVVVHSGGQQVAGTMEGVDDSGALLLRAGDTIQTVHGGEVSLRSAH